MVNTETVREYRAFRSTRQPRSTRLLYTIERQGNVCDATMKAEASADIDEATTFAHF